VVAQLESSALDPPLVAASIQKLMRFFRFILTLAVLLCPGVTARAEMADGINAIVNDTVITYAQVEDFTARDIDLLHHDYADQPDVFQQKLNELLNDGLEQLIERQLILHDFDVEGYILPDSVLDGWVEDSIRKRFGDRITLIRTLQAQGITLEQYREQIRDQNIVTYMRSKKVSQEIIVSPFKIENYYLAHQDDFKVEDEIKLHMIVLNKTSPDDTDARRMAKEILDQIKQGATFQAMASLYSQDSQRNQGGDWGWVERSVLRKELANVAFKLKTGQISDVIEMPEACYLMLVEQTRSAHVKPLNDVRNEIEATLRAQEQKQLEQEWIESLKKKNYIRIIP
jgi:peptidyl-prolyl cis-trans isomerase SurA